MYFKYCSIYNTCQKFFMGRKTKQWLSICANLISVGRNGNFVVDKNVIASSICGVLCILISLILSKEQNIAKYVLRVCILITGQMKRENRKIIINVTNTINLNQGSPTFSSSRASRTPCQGPSGRTHLFS